MTSAPEELHTSSKSDHHGAMIVGGSESESTLATTPSRWQLPSVVIIYTTWKDSLMTASKACSHSHASSPLR